MSSNHETILSLADVILSKRGVRLFPNVVGAGWTGKVVEQYPSSAGQVVTLVGASFHAFGLLAPVAREFVGKGNGRRKAHGGTLDRVGWRPLVITREMVGQTIAQFVALDAKTPGYNTMSPEQKNWSAQVVKAGGLVLIARRDGDDGVIFDEVRGDD